MFNIDHPCTYQYYDPNLRRFVDMWKDTTPEYLRQASTYNIQDVLEFEEFADFLYQLDFLQCFHLKEELDSLVIDQHLETMLSYLESRVGKVAFLSNIYHPLSVIHASMPPLSPLQSAEEIKNASKMLLGFLCSYHYLFVTHAFLKLMAEEEPDDASFSCVEWFVQQVLHIHDPSLQAAGEAHQVGADSESCARSCRGSDAGNICI